MNERNIYDKVVARCFESIIMSQCISDMDQFDTRKLHHELTNLYRSVNVPGAGFVCIQSHVLLNENIIIIM